MHFTQDAVRKIYDKGMHLDCLMLGSWTKRWILLRRKCFPANHGICMVRFLARIGQKMLYWKNILKFSGMPSTVWLTLLPYLYDFRTWSFWWEHYCWIFEEGYPWTGLQNIFHRSSSLLTIQHSKSSQKTMLQLRKTSLTLTKPHLLKNTKIFTSRQRFV